MLSKLTITQKGLALIAIPLLFQIILAAALISGQAYRSRVERWAIHTKEVIAQAETFFRVLVEADSQVNAYAMTGDPRSVATFDQLLARLPDETSALGNLVADNPTQVERVHSIAGKASRFADEMRTLHHLAQTKDTVAATARLQDFSIRAPIAEIRAELDSFVGSEAALDRERLAALATIQAIMAWGITGGMAALLLTGLLCAWFFGRTIVGRLAVLNENVRRITAGESLATRVGGTDEVAVLDESFHRMAESLKDAAEKEKKFQLDLERRAGELTVINRELMQKSDENEMFVYSVSHDLRSPLVNLQGFSKELGIAMREMRELFHAVEVPPGMRAQGDDILDHGMAEPVTFIQTAVTRLSAIIDALLRLSRAGRVEYQRKDVDTAEVARRVIDATRSVMSEKKAQVSIVGGLPRVWGDPTAVEQIFANLIGNALNYLDRKRPGVIEVGSSAYEGDPGLVTCYVKDNGLGIPEAYLGKIFGIFQRVHGNVAVGEGIGLALVRRMVERHGGRIWVESTENVGSTFFVALPKVDLPAEPSPSAETMAPVAVGAA